MRHVVLALVVLFAAAVALPVATATPAAAFGDTCHRDVRVRGAVQPTMSSARDSAIAAWEKVVSQRYGARFANWYYSADRTFECSWDATGTRIRCLAIATPCGRKG